MADYWIKLYHEIIDDPKMATLPDRLWRRAIEVFLLAGKLCPDKSGELPDTRQLAWLLRMPTDDLQTDLVQLASTGILQATKSGWEVVNFNKRQSAVPGAERVKQHRERKQKQEYYEGVTDLKRNVTQIQSRAETETETEAKSGGAGDSPEFINMRNLLTTIVGLPATPNDIPGIEELVELGVTEEDIRDALGWRKDNGKKPVRTLSQLFAGCITSRDIRVQNGNASKSKKPEPSMPYIGS